MKYNFFVKLLETGQMKFENGLVIIFNAHNILFPVRSFLKLRELLIKNFGENGENILREVGKYQIEQALKRYSKLFKIEKLQTSKIEEFGFMIIGLLGLGKFQAISFDKSLLKIIIRSKNLPTGREYLIIYGKSKQPIDSYLCGIWEEAYSRVFAKKMQCTETKCIACGDKFCQFEICPAKKPK